MYGWLWSHLPGPTAVRAVLAVLLFVAVVAVLFLWVFPWVEPRLPFTDVTVDGSAAALVPQVSGLGWMS
jgi:multidrug resistance efflux pump